MGKGTFLYFLSLLVTIILLTLSATSEKYAKLVKEISENENDRDSRQCSLQNGVISFLKKKEFSSSRKMSIEFADEPEDMTRILQNVHIPYTVNGRETGWTREDVDERTPSDVVLMMAKSLNVSRSLKTTLWTRDTRFLICYYQRVSEEELLRAFECFWAENVVNVVAIVSDSERILFFGFVPFSERGCDKLKIISIDPESLKFISIEKIADFHGCVLNATVVDLPPMVIFPDSDARNGTFRMEGTEIAIIQEVEKKLNFTTWYSSPKDGLFWGWIHPSPSGIVGEVYLKNSHFGVGHLVTTLERHQFLDVSTSVSPLMECITFAVPVGAAKRQAVWMEIYLSEFSPELWLGIGLIFGLSLLTFGLLARLHKAPARDALEVGMYLFSAFLNLPVNPSFQKYSKTFFTVYIWYSFVVVVSYESLMRSKLTVPYRPREIDTIPDLLESNLRCTGFHNTIMFVTHEAEGDVKKLTTRFRATEYGIKEALDLVLTQRNIAYMREISSFEYYMVNNPQAKEKVHFMKECVSRYYPIMVLQRNGPVTKTLNKIIRQLFEAGILLKWRDRYIYNAVPGPPPIIRLSLRHTLAPFMALLIGFLLSVVAFLIENIYHQKPVKYRLRKIHP